MATWAQDLTRNTGPVRQQYCQLYHCSKLYNHFKVEKWLISSIMKPFLRTTMALGPFLWCLTKMATRTGPFIHCNIKLLYILMSMPFLTSGSNLVILPSCSYSISLLIWNYVFLFSCWKVHLQSPFLPNMLLLCMTKLYIVSSNTNPLVFPKTLDDAFCDVFCGLLLRRGFASWVCTLHCAGNLSLWHWLCLIVF